MTLDHQNVGSFHVYLNTCCSFHLPFWIIQLFVFIPFSVSNHYYKVTTPTLGNFCYCFCFNCCILTNQANQRKTLRSYIPMSKSSRSLLFSHRLSLSPVVTSVGLFSFVHCTTALLFHLPIPLSHYFPDLKSCPNNPFDMN